MNRCIRLKSAAKVFAPRTYVTKLRDLNVSYFLLVATSELPEKWSQYSTTKTLAKRFWTKKKLDTTLVIPPALLLESLCEPRDSGHYRDVPYFINPSSSMGPSLLTFPHLPTCIAKEPCRVKSDIASLLQCPKPTHLSRDTNTFNTVAEQTLPGDLHIDAPRQPEREPGK